MKYNANGMTMPYRDYYRTASTSLLFLLGLGLFIRISARAQWTGHFISDKAGGE